MTHSNSFAPVEQIRRVVGVEGWPLLWPVVITMLTVRRLVGPVIAVIRAVALVSLDKRRGSYDQDLQGTVYSHWFKAPTIATELGK